jgi:hypothetical protein
MTLKQFTESRLYRMDPVENRPMTEKGITVNNEEWINEWMKSILLKGLSYEIDFENVDENGQILA